MPVESRGESDLSSHDNETPHTPPPSLWPIGFAVGIAVLLTGLVVSPVAAVVGAVIALIFGFLWIRDVTRPVRTPAPEVEPETRASLPQRAARGATTRRSDLSAQHVPRREHARPRRRDRRRITLPVLGFAVLPSFTNQERRTSISARSRSSPRGSS